MLLAVLERLRERIPELVVLVTGPSRGYVLAGLERLGIPARHVLLPSVEDVARAYDAIDVCLVTSRDEGGPRAVLEAMAIGVPIVSTRAGQATDLVRHGENGWLADVDDVDALVEATAGVAAARVGRAHVACCARGARRPRRTRTTRFARAGASFCAGSSRCRSRRGGSERGTRRAATTRAAERWARLLVAGKPEPGVRVFYGQDDVPAPGERAAGGTAKLQKLAERFPNTPVGFSVLYLGSNGLPRDLGPLLWLARRRGIPVVAEPGRRRVPGLGGRGDASDQRADAARAATRPTTSCTRASSRGGLRTASSASRAGRGRCCRMRST